MLRKLIYKNFKGQEIIFGNSAPIILTKLEGESGLEVDLQTSKSPYQDGETFLDSVLPMRIISIEGALIHDINMYRRKLLETFSPKSPSGTLKYISNSFEREIPVVVDNGVIFPDKGTSPFQKFLITLCAPMPFWLEAYTERQEMADWIGGLLFGLQLPAMFAGRSSRTNTVIRNSGDVETPIKITFSGGAKNPVVKHIDSGAFIRVKKDISPNENLYISTEFGNKKVLLINNITKETVNAFGYIDLDSTFFQLNVGDNQMNFDSDSGSANITVRLEWRNRFLGV